MRKVLALVLIALVLLVSIAPVEAAHKIAANSKTKVYHPGHCYPQTIIKPTNLVWFDTVQQAITAGYHACGAKGCK
jgi:hypothetical protein